jgi:DNA-binding response OmpR family regulator
LADGRRAERLKVLIIDDDHLLVDAIMATLGSEWPDCSITIAADGRSGLQSLMAVEPDLVLLDIGLPGESGYEVLKRIRRLSDVPVVIITARSEELVEVRGLQLGADDFIVKPFAPAVLIARVRSLLRRSSTPPRERAMADRIAGDLVIDFQTHEVTLHGHRLPLTPVEYRLLYCLARNPERLIPHRKLIELVWGRVDRSALGRLHVYVKRLRDKIEDNGVCFIENQRGLGYRFIRPAESDPAAANGRSSGAIPVGAIS